ncbi:MAG: response regulator transcription factor [Planctomycetia bacterium]|nr:response regulator transcription factor [Planctomycetia bacterium]
MKVLVVEDDPTIADFLVRGLREEGCAVDHAARGDEAWGRMSASPWDVIVLDWRLPGPDGLTLLKRLRREGDLTPVLFLTARDTVDDRVQSLDSGADDYLCKPFAFDELLARLRALVRRRDYRTDAVLKYADVSLDLVSHRAERGGAPLNLTAKEESLLAFLLRHPEQVLSRNRIYEQVWDERYDGLSNTLEVHIMELRRKLEARGPRLIHTLRGRGYWLGNGHSEKDD